MKRLLMILFAVGIVTATSVSMAGMSTSKVRQNTRFLTDKMAYELNLSTEQYNDAYEINFDFIYNVRNLMDDVARGYDWAIDRYYQYLDVRNDDLRWILSNSQYRRFLGLDYFYRPIYTSGRSWNFRIYVTYSNHNHFYFDKPYHYRTYCGSHYRTHYNNVSFYRNRYRHDVYHGNYGIRNDKVYHNHRRSDFGNVRSSSENSSRRTSSSRSESSNNTTRRSNSSGHNRTGSSSSSSSRRSSVSSSGSSSSSRSSKTSRSSSSTRRGGSSSRSSEVKKNSSDNSYRSSSTGSSRHR